jgi:hypothetical protein
MMVCAWLVWRSSDRRHFQKFQMLKSKHLVIVTNAPWYVRNVQIHENL